METAAAVTVAAGSPRWTSTRIFIIGTLSMLDVLLSSCYSMISPFFPPLAESRGVAAFWVGFVFAIYQVAILFSCGYWGDKVSKHGPVKILKFGILVLSGSLMAFASLSSVGVEWLFVLLALSLRLLGGIGAGMILTGVLTIITQEFSDRIGQVTGWLEGIATTTGYLIGPVLGGFLYDAVGFWLPFVTFGGCLLLFGAACWLLFRNYNDIRPYPAGQPASEPIENDPLLQETARPKEQPQLHNISVAAMLRTPVVWVVGCCLVCASSSLGLIEVGLAIHANELNNATNNTALSEVGKNALFFITPASYGVFVLILGKYIDVLKTYRLFFNIGLVLCTVGCLFIGPSPLIVGVIPGLEDAHAKLISTIVSLVVLGSGFSFCVAPFVPVLMVIALNKGWPECTATSGAASGCVGVFYCLGMVFGPSVASPLCGKFGFSVTGFIFACVNAVYFVCFVVYSTMRRTLFTDHRQREELADRDAPSSSYPSIQS